MTSKPDHADVIRAADAVMEAYGGEGPQHALRQAIRAETQASSKAFAQAVREEIERRCLEHAAKEQAPAASGDHNATPR